MSDDIHDDNLYDIREVREQREDLFEEQSIIPKMPKTISNSINLIMTDIKTLARNDTNNYQKYNYASIDQFLMAVNPLCAKHGLIINVDEEDMRIMKTSDKSAWVHIIYKFILSHQSGDTWNYPLRRNMILQITGGQSIGAAMSYVLKGFMRSLFQIATGEKNELDGKADGDDLDNHNQTFTQSQVKSKDTKHNQQRRKY
jgi:hypothetical protein